MSVVQKRDNWPNCTKPFFNEKKPLFKLYLLYVPILFYMFTLVGICGQIVQS